MLIPHKPGYRFEIMSGCLRIGKVLLQVRKQDKKDLWIGAMYFNLDIQINKWMVKIGFFGFTIYVWRPWWIA